MRWILRSSKFDQANSDSSESRKFSIESEESSAIALEALALYSAVLSLSSRVMPVVLKYPAICIIVA